MNTPPVTPTPRKRRAAQGIGAELEKQPEARRWLHGELGGTHTLASISAELLGRFGIQAKVGALSDYLRRHSAEILPTTERAIVLGEGQYLLTIHAPGALHVEAHLAPLESGASHAAKQNER